MTAHPFERQPQGGATTKPLRPKDAATLILLDRSGEGTRVLVGKRGGGHAFMPNVYVFPGGRRDRTDHAMPVLRDLHPDVLRQLANGTDDEAAIRRGRALALAAIRELREETGLTIGQTESSRSKGERLIADLGSLRYVARAVTPPGNIRRFDTRFFCTFTDEAGVDPEQIRDSDELHDLRWLDIDGNSGLNIPPITQTILDDVKTLMAANSSLPFGSEGPFYFTQRGRFMRGSI